MDWDAIDAEEQFIKLVQDILDFDGIEVDISEEARHAYGRIKTWILLHPAWVERYRMNQQMERMGY